MCGGLCKVVRGMASRVIGVSFGPVYSEFYPDSLRAWGISANLVRRLGYRLGSSHSLLFK